MPSIVSINGGSPVTQYQQDVPVVIADGDTADLTEFYFAGFSVPFTVVDATNLTFNAPGTVKRNYETESHLDQSSVEGGCVFNISHAIKVPSPGSTVDDDSILAGLGYNGGRFAKLILPGTVDLEGVTQIRGIEAVQNADNYLAAEFGTQTGAELAASVEVLNPTGDTQTYPVTFVAGANDPGTFPVLTVYGGNPKQIALGASFTPDYSAIDDTEGDITGRVVVTGAVNTNAVGDYVISFSITNVFNRTSTATQTVQVRQNVRYELRLLASLDQNVQSVTGSYAEGFIVSQNGSFGACSLGPIELVNGEAVITQDNIISGSLAALVAGGSTMVMVVLADDAKNVAALPRFIPITAVAI